MNDSKKTKNQLVSELDELRHSEERLSLALEAAHMARWEWDLQSGEIIWSENFEPLLGLAPGTFEDSTGPYEKYK